jgi:hypothetical protein
VLLKCVAYFNIDKTRVIPFLATVKGTVGGSHDKSLINEGATAPEFSAFRPIEINGLRVIFGGRKRLLSNV